MAEVSRFAAFTDEELEHLELALDVQYFSGDPSERMHAEVNAELARRKTVHL